MFLKTDIAACLLANLLLLVNKITKSKTSGILAKENCPSGCPEKVSKNSSQINSTDSHGFCFFVIAGCNLDKDCNKELCKIIMTSRK